MTVPIIHEIINPAVKKLPEKLFIYVVSKDTAKTYIKRLLNVEVIVIKNNL